MYAWAAELTETVLAAPTAEAASRAFFEKASHQGATYLQTRLYRRPEGVLTSEKHLAAGGVVVRIAPEDWPDSPGFTYVCLQNNPLLAAVQRGLTRYRFSDFAPRSDRKFGAYWEAISEAGIGEALCATSYAAGATIASLHLGFARADVEPGVALALQATGLVLTEKLTSFADLPPASEPHLTVRERDVLTWVAEGKSDWEIAVILGVSEPTVRFHLDNARRKLGAVNRVQAAARFVVGGRA